MQLRVLRVLLVKKLKEVPAWVTIASVEIIATLPMGNAEILLTEVNQISLYDQLWCTHARLS